MAEKQRAVVLHSGGLDSSVNFLEALEKFEVVLALTMDYGQRAAARELECATKQCMRKKTPHRVLSLPWFRELGASSLLNQTSPLPLGAEVQIDSLAHSQKTAKSVWVPNRNGVFIEIAASFAESLGATQLIVGFNKEEAATFPDNSEAYLFALNQALQYSTSNGVQVECFSKSWDKVQIVKRGTQLGIHWGELWPCYQSFEKWCGRCESCLRFKRALGPTLASQLSELFIKGVL